MKRRHFSPEEKMAIVLTGLKGEQSAARLVRELERKLPANQYESYFKEIEIFKKVLSQKKESKDKIYSLCEPQVLFAFLS